MTPPSSVVCSSPSPTLPNVASVIPQSDRNRSDPPPLQTGTVLHEAELAPNPVVVKKEVIDDPPPTSLPIASSSSPSASSVSSSPPLPPRTVTPILPHSKTLTSHQSARALSRLMRALHAPPLTSVSPSLNRKSNFIPILPKTLPSTTVHDNVAPSQSTSFFGDPAPLSSNATSLTYTSPHYSSPSCVTLSSISQAYNKRAQAIGIQDSPLPNSTSDGNSIAPPPGFQPTLPSSASMDHDAPILRSLLTDPVPPIAPPCRSCPLHCGNSRSPSECLGCAVHCPSSSQNFAQQVKKTTYSVVEETRDNFGSSISLKRSSPIGSEATGTHPSSVPSSIKSHRSDARYIPPHRKSPGGQAGPGQNTRHIASRRPSRTESQDD